ncbi:DUF3788 domain-containing protein [Candidatus Formimonas warabiya]|uniref:DUF3788 domain-containing protein n=1 Tax=Formimonas warabiya TaxID=1761012 RepID=A0A3G1KSF5_FORW1|nr:DUF3788 domain-containing protein [Candidatus Formimonas warabiya]ATW25085.1 hypothetical protein DCMF_10125 [Candidatus Formimonas warabiya]
MKWSELFTINQMPSFEEIKQFIGEGEPLLSELHAYINRAYQIQPQMAYSKCSAQPGWNLKYRKSSKSLCTLYPLEGYVIALVVIGAKEEEEVEMALETFTPYVQNLYRKTSFSCGGRWLMIEVRDKSVLDDIKRLMAIRLKPQIAS